MLVDRGWDLPLFVSLLRPSPADPDVLNSAFEDDGIDRPPTNHDPGLHQSIGRSLVSDVVETTQLVKKRPSRKGEEGRGGRTEVYVYRPGSVIRSVSSVPTRGGPVGGPLGKGKGGGPFSSGVLSFGGQKTFSSCFVGPDLPLGLPLRPRRAVLRYR